MVFFRRILLIIACCFCSSSHYAQDLTGRWEGDLGNTEFLQVNIVQIKDQLCGYSWDSIYNEKGNFCKAYFTSMYERERNEWVLTGSSFIENSGEHILMRLRLKYKVVNGKEILEGTETDPSTAGSIFSFLMRQKVYLRKVSKKPSRAYMQECIKLKKQKKTPQIAQPDIRDKKIIVPVKPTKIDKKAVPVKPADTVKKKNVPAKPVETKRSDSLKKITPVFVPVISKNDSQLVKSMAVRKNKEMKRLLVNEKNIMLEVYDNGIVDSDTVSVFYNGKLLLSHKRLSEKPILIPISLDETTTVHEIILFAENLGSIPPNTALIVVKAGDKRYELYASASLTENAVIIFEYKPK